MTFLLHLLTLLASIVGSALATGATTETVVISCGGVGQEYQHCKSGTEAWAAQNGHRVEFISTPHSSTERLALYQQLLAAGSSDIDIFQIDVVWPGILGDYFIDLTPYSKGAESHHFAQLVANNRVDGRLIAMPWFTDAGLLYHRSDLLEKYGERPPQTWQELGRIAARIQDAERAAGNSKMWGFVWQGRAYEGLTCNALEWVASFNGGHIIEADGRISVSNESAARALTTAASWVGAISPPGVLNYAEEEARGVFQSGNAVFMRNWPYAWPLTQSEDSPVRDRVGVSRLPQGGSAGRHAAVLGGWQLAVSRFSAKPALAADLVLYLTSRQEQRRRALIGAYNPTIPGLYQDPELLQANPFFAIMQEVLEGAVARPSAPAGRYYNRVSSRFWSSAHSVLSGQQSAEAALTQLSSDLDRIQRRGR
jgi:trehalose/maltose transport system substrate-binding protein